MQALALLELYRVEPSAALAAQIHVYPHERDHQCAYDLSPLVLGLEELHLLKGCSGSQ